MDARRHDAIEAQLDRLEEDPFFAEEMALCEELRIPHSEFFEWAEADQVKAIAFRRRRLLRCPRCGSSDHDFVDPETGRLFEIPLVQTKVDRCFGCMEVEKTRDGIDADDRAGLTVRLVKRRGDEGE